VAAITHAMAIKGNFFTRFLSFNMKIEQLSRSNVPLIFSTTGSG